MKIRSALRSHRLAASLLVAFFAYAMVATLLPRDIGLRPYSSPIFFMLAFLLTAATAVCAWERSKSSYRSWTTRGLVTEGVRRRLHTAPTFVIETDFHDHDAALTSAWSGLRRLRLRVRKGPVLLEGSSGFVGLAGSPLFHWALVGVFVAVAIGQLVRYEGYANVVGGQEFRDQAAAYGLLQRGLLSNRFTDYSIRVLDIERDLVVAGVSRGITPRVAVARRGDSGKTQWVYSNHPLRYGSLMVHNREAGDSVIGSVRFDGVSSPQPVAVHFSRNDVAGSFVGGFHVMNPSTAETITVLLATRPEKTVAVRWGSPNQRTITATEGESIELAPGVAFVVDRLTTHVQLIVVNDPSMPWVYLFFILGSIGAGITAFLPARTVHVLVRGKDEGRVTLAVLVSARRSDPAFAGRVHRALTQACETDSSKESA